MDGIPKLSNGGEERIQRKNSSTGSIATDRMKLLDITRDRPTKVAVKVMVPVRDHPRFNFVGKLLGPKGNSMKRLQEETMCKMVVLGRGSMKDRKKEDELRKSADPRYAHLSQDLHIEISTFAPPAEAHARVAYALAEVRRFLVPDNYDDIRQEQKLEMEALNSSPTQMQADDQTSSNDASDIVSTNEGSILGSDSFFKDTDTCSKSGNSDLDKCGSYGKCMDSEVDKRNQINLQASSMHPTAVAAALQQQLATNGLGFMKPLTGIAPLAGVIPGQGVIGIPSEAEIAMPALTLLKAPEGILPATRGISTVNLAGNFGRKRPLHTISDKNPMKRSVMTLLARARTSQAIHAGRRLNGVEIAKPIQVATTSPYII